MRKSSNTNLLYYFSITVVTSLLSLISIPTTIHFLGGSIWGAISLGQVIGNITGIFIALGSVINGPSLISKSTSSQIQHILRISTRIKVIILLPASVVSFTASFFIAHNHNFIAGISSILINFSALSFSWFFIGKEQPGKLWLLEVLPRSFGVTLSLISLIITKSIFIYFALQILMIILSYASSYLYLRDRTLEDISDRPSVRQYYEYFTNQMRSLETVIYSATYLALPLILIARIAPDALASYAIGDKIVRYFSLVSGPLTQWLQGWVPNAANLVEMKSRIRKNIRINSSFGLVSAIIILFFGDYFTQIMSQHQLHLTISSMIPISISVFLSFTARGTGIVGLISMGFDKHVSRSALLGAIASLPLLLLLIHNFSYVGAFWSLMFSQSLVLGYQVLFLVRFMEPGRRQKNPDKEVIMSTKGIKFD